MRVELRLLLARSPAALDRILFDAIFGWQRVRARELGLATHAVRGAGITHVERFGDAMNLNVHLHAAVCDCVSVRAYVDGPVFRPSGPRHHPSSKYARAISPVRFVRWLDRHGLLRPATAPDEAVPCGAPVLPPGGVVAIPAWSTYPPSMPDGHPFSFSDPVAAL